MIETSFGKFEIIKDEKNIFNIADFEKRYCEILKKYQYIVGDYYQDNLRLKGFREDNINTIPDYINEYCTLDSQYFLIKNLEFDPNYVVPED